MRKVILFILVFTLFYGCEKTNEYPASIQEYLKDKVVHDILSDPTGSKFYFLSSQLDNELINEQPWRCFIPSKYQLSCTDGNIILYFEDLPYINAVAVDDQCNLYAAIYPKIVKFTPPHDSITIKSCENGFTSLAIDSAGRLWAGSYSEGVYLFENQVWKHFTSLNSDIAGDQILDITASKRSPIWIATYGNTYSISVFLGSSFKTYGLNELTGAEGGNIVHIAADSQGNAWVHYYLNNQNFLIRVLVNGEAENPVSLPSPLNITNLDNDFEGNIYLINLDGSEYALYIYKHGNEIMNGPYEVPAERILYDALLDNSGNLWYGTNKGVIKKKVSGFELK